MAGIGAGAWRTGGAAAEAGRMGSWFRTRAHASEDKATRAEAHSAADGGMEHMDCGGRESVPAGACDSTGAPLGAFQDGEAQQAVCEGLASWATGGECCLHRWAPAGDQAANK